MLALSLLSALNSFSCLRSAKLLTVLGVHNLIISDISHAFTDALSSPFVCDRAVIWRKGTLPREANLAPLQLRLFALRPSSNFRNSSRESRPDGKNILISVITFYDFIMMLQREIEKAIPSRSLSTSLRKTKGKQLKANR